MKQVKKICLIILVILLFVGTISLLVTKSRKSDVNTGSNQTTTAETLATAHAHNYTTFIIDASCVVDGTITETCIDCKDTIITSISAFGHNYKTETIEPTCFEEGKVISVCTNCHDEKIQILKPRKHNYFGGYCEYCGKENLVSLGTFRLTAYCACKHCSGKWGNLTASGKIAQVNHTIAVDPKVIPLGTEVYIFGKKYVAEDTGSGIKNKSIDIYFNSHEEAVKFGIKYTEVFIKGA